MLFSCVGKELYILIRWQVVFPGLKGSGIQQSSIVGIAAVRFIFLPLLGIMIVKGALRFGLVHPDPLFQFVLLLQYAVPPAINLGMEIYSQTAIIYDVVSLI